ncbi:acetyl-CoA carboxylase biotin carboxyl carrier protein subunit [Crateriforma conspicua]|uniref:2-oxoglutarate carboxylase large subunit n=1 Tax=Crateriforma conspicua TaxID=2527996 RepID=A0A5C5YBH2_9PLAN|nr:biotin/lipoyl-containing protein [Crateriforma conspicua]QDV65237.1 2-oxoglutarate carboxylase large subunit [Crateriforma conspicua]TWT70632.1 2-oxoglutarate carboxylase large subunit [Crateriforma conspicua]
MKLKIKIDGDVYEVEVDVAEEESPQPGFVPASESYQAPGVAPPVAPPSGGGGQVVEDESKVCRSPVSGVVIRVPVEVGEEIEQDQELMVLEAMKMETVITAPIAGKIAKLNAEVGGSVKANDVLIEFE